MAVIYVFQLLEASSSFNISSLTCINPLPGIVTPLRFPGSFLNKDSMDLSLYILYPSVNSFLGTSPLPMQQFLVVRSVTVTAMVRVPGFSLTHA